MLAGTSMSVTTLSTIVKAAPILPYVPFLITKTSGIPLRSRSVIIASVYVGSCEIVLIIRVTNGSRQFSFAAFVVAVVPITARTARTDAISLFFIFNTLSVGYYLQYTIYAEFCQIKRLMLSHQP